MLSDILMAHDVVYLGNGATMTVSPELEERGMLIIMLQLGKKALLCFQIARFMLVTRWYNLLTTLNSPIY